MSEDRTMRLHETYYTTRDTVIRDELLERYLPLCRSVAAKFSGRGVEREDLEQVAAMALLSALERFDPTKGFRFSSFAVPTVTGAIRNHIRDRGDGMRLPRDIRLKLYQMTKAQERYEQQYHCTPSAYELAAYMGISPDELLTLLDAAQQQNAVSLDSAVGDDGDSTLEAFLGRSDTRFEQLERSDMMNWLLSKLNAQEQELLTLRYVQQLGQRETAKHLGVSQMQVSRLERRILARLRTLATTENDQMN